MGSVGLNLFGTAVAGELRLPVYLDMIGTATAAFALGPWYGLAVGVSTNLLAALITSPETMLFGLVNAAGAVLWGYGIRRFAHTIPRFVVLNLVVALVCTLIAAPLNCCTTETGRATSPTRTSPHCVPRKACGSPSSPSTSSHRLPTSSSPGSRRSPSRVWSLLCGCETSPSRDSSAGDHAAAEAIFHVMNVA